LTRTALSWGEGEAGPAQAPSSSLRLARALAGYQRPEGSEREALCALYAEVQRRAQELGLRLEGDAD
jgi:hypothetical protein